VNTTRQQRPSLESLIESESIGMDILHPGGLEITAELARMCGIGKTSSVLDVASGTGESACFLAGTLGAAVTGIDGSRFMLDRARKKAAERGLPVAFVHGDAAYLPFADGSFDAVISECTTCLLDKQQVIAEMVRVVRPGGWVGIHDICWQPHTPGHLRQRLAELEGERPETLAGWLALFQEAGLVDVEGVDKSPLLSAWTQNMARQLGIGGRWRIFRKLFRIWGLRGLLDAWQSERIFRNRHTGYGIIVGRKPGPRQDRSHKNTHT